MHGDALLQFFQPVEHDRHAMRPPAAGVLNHQKRFVADADIEVCLTGARVLRIVSLEHGYGLTDARFIVGSSANRRRHQSRAATKVQLGSASRPDWLGAALDGYGPSALAPPEVAQIHLEASGLV